MDYRWLGQPESPTYGYHIERFAKDAKEMIDDAKIDKFYLFGHSMGNAVSWCYFSIFGQEKVLKPVYGYYETHPVAFNKLAIDFFKD